MLAALAERNPQTRVLLLRTLVQIPESRAIQLVIGWSIRPDEPIEEIRKMCVEELQRQISTQPEIRSLMIAVYRDVLRKKNVDQTIIDSAARVLADIGGHEAVPELIDVLVVARTETIQNQPQPYRFGSGGTGYGQAGKPIPVTVPVPNMTVLSALRKLTGENFEFDQSAWRNWYRQSLRSPHLNLRRS